MMIPGKLEIAIKINQLPTEVTTTKHGWKEFKLDCGERTVTVALRPRMWNKRTDAAATWPMWLAAISGQMGQSVGQGFVLLEPSVQVFERKAKEPLPPAGEAGAAETQEKSFGAEGAPAPALSGPPAPVPVPAVPKRAVAAPSPTVEARPTRRRAVRLGRRLGRRGIGSVSQGRDCRLR